MRWPVPITSPGMRATYVRGTPAERFWPKVDQAGPTPEHRPDLGACWTWTAALRPDGYGAFNAGGKAVRSHVWAWEQEHGPVPEGLELDHLCRRPSCVRPSHLEAVTHAENSRRGLAGKYQAERTHCPAGHAYDEANTRVRPRGRACRACGNEADRRRRRERKAGLR